MKRQKFEHLKIAGNGKYCKKTSFAKQEDADYYVTKLKRTSKRDVVPVRSYLCPKCLCWHLTSWEQLDIDNAITCINSEIELMQIRYNEEFDALMEVVNGIKLEAQQAQIDNNNLRLENYKIKYELNKIKEK